MRALIFGVTGQDGSYLAELLLNKGYEVHGVLRRSSSFNTSRIDHIFNRITFHYGDLSDSLSIVKLIYEIQPDEIYNLAAMSHVKVSFDIPKYSRDIVGLGALEIYEACHILKSKAKIYNASSSEMFGSTPPPQSEISPMNPRSPYAAAKLYAYHMGRNYRDGYGMFICNGILFNHESLPKNSPVLINRNGSIDILPIEDLFKSEKHRYEGIRKEYENALVWNGSDWTKIISGTAYRDFDKPMRIIQTRDSSIETTLEHSIFLEDDEELESKDIGIGDRIYKTTYPTINGELNNDLAYFIGFVVGDGYISPDGNIRLTGTDKTEIESVASLLTNKFGWDFRINTYGTGSYENCTVPVWQLDINNNSDFGKWLRSEIYTEFSNEKRVPRFILNSSADTKMSFFDGYYAADGRKSGNETYGYKGFTTKSATLCLGLIYILKSYSSQKAKVKCEYRDNRRYYYTQFDCGYDTNKGKHLIKDKNVVISTTDTYSEDGWFYDLQTESQTFASGPNLIKIHNSPRRGETFVTRKITRAATRIKLGLQNELRLGNIDSKRDWGYAKDFVYAMWMMLQQDKPDDFVVATGENHTIKEFLDLSFGHLSLDWHDYVIIDPNYFRPTEVENLLGNPSKARNELGWYPKCNFDNLVKLMVEYDLELAKKEANG